MCFLVVLMALYMPLIVPSAWQALERPCQRPWNRRACFMNLVNTRNVPLDPDPSPGWAPPGPFISLYQLTKKPQVLRCLMVIGEGS